MLVSSAPIVIPVNTANLPTESVAVDAAQRPKIPQPASPTESSSTKNTTEFNEQSKSAIENNVLTEQDKSVEEKEQSEQQRENDAQSEAQNQAQNSASENPRNEPLQANDLQLVRQLQSRDREVRTHEQAHTSAGGNLTGSPNLNFTTGPDGKRYAVSGDVSIDVSTVANDPAATIRKLEQVQRAALAPASPSSQDLKVASQAASSANQARSELNVQRLETQQSEKNDKTSEAESETSSSVDRDKESLKETDTADIRSLSSPLQLESLLNPVIARRQAAQLNQKIEGSGALQLETQGNQLSVTA